MIYAVNTDITAPEVLTDSDTILALSNQKYFHFYVDSIDMAQQKPNIMSDAMRKAAIAISQTMDTTVSAAVNSGVKAANKVTMEVATDATVADAGEALLTAFTDVKHRMRLENISKTIVPWAVLSAGHLQILEKFFILEGKTGIFLPGTSEETLRSGFMGNLLGINLFWSNRCPKTTNSAALKDVILAGTMDSFTYADNVTEMESYRPEKRFGEAVKGLYVYGVKVTEPDQLFRIANTA